MLGANPIESLTSGFLLNLELNFVAIVKLSITNALLTNQS